MQFFAHKMDKYSAMKTGRLWLLIAITSLFVASGYSQIITALPRTNAATAFDDLILNLTNAGGTFTTKKVSAGALGDAMRGLYSASAAGAKGDGTTDDTAAIQAMLNTGRAYLPPGRFVVGNLTLTTNCVIRGCGESTVLVRKAGTTGYLIDCATWQLDANGFALSGGGGTTSAGIHGLRLWGVNTPIVSQVSIRGFDGEAIYVTGDFDVLKRSNRWAIISCNIETNWTGIRLASGNGAEYGSILNNRITRVINAIDNSSANIEIAGNSIVDCLGIGYYLHPDNGRGHSSFTGNMLNHSYIPVLVTNVTTAALIANNVMLACGQSNTAWADPFLIITNSNGIDFSGNLIQSGGGGKVWSGGVGTNFFYNNKLVASVDTIFRVTNAYTFGNVQDGKGVLNFGWSVVNATASGTNTLVAVSGGSLVTTNQAWLFGDGFGGNGLSGRVLMLQPDGLVPAGLYFQNAYPGVHAAWQVDQVEHYKGAGIEFKHFPEGGASFVTMAYVKTNGVIAVTNNLVASNLVYFNYSSSSNITACGTIYQNLVTVNNTSTTETIFYTNRFNAGFFKNNGDSINLFACGTTALNANTKTVKIYFGSTVVLNLAPTLNNTPWVLHGKITRTGATTQKCVFYFLGSGQAVNVRYQIASETMANELGLGLTWTGGASSDISAEQYRIEFYPNP